MGLKQKDAWASFISRNIISRAQKQSQFLICNEQLATLKRTLTLRHNTIPINSANVMFTYLIQENKSLEMILK